MSATGLRRPSPWHLVLLPLALLMAAPLIWMVITSVSTLEETRHFPPQLPNGIHLHSYVQAWTESPFGRWLLNSAVVSIACVVSNLVLCTLAGYAFARLHFPGSQLAFLLILATLMVPFQVVMIPTFLIVQKLSLADSLTALALPNLVTPFGIFLLRQFFRTLPVELEEAARIDGASRLKVLFRIVLPLSLPALATLAVIQFLWTWNDFLWPLVTIYKESAFTLQLGLMSFQGSHVNDTNLLMAGNVMSMLPMLILFIAAQRYFVRGIATQGLKG